MLHKGNDASLQLCQAGQALLACYRKAGGVDL
jgi:hypothetical protein